MKKLSVKRALIGSVMSLLVCIAMFAGTTFAWFTDSAKSTGNKITAGTLDLELSLYNPAISQFENISNSTTPIFSVENWAPGSEELQSATIMIENTGSLNFEVALDFVSTGDSKLAEVIEVYKSWTNPTVALGAAPATKTELDEALGNNEYAGPITLEYALKATQYRGIVESGEKIYLGVAMYLPGIVGNEYQGLDAEFDFIVRAKQLKGEFEDLPNEGFRTPVGATFPADYYNGKQEVSLSIDNTSVTIPTSSIADTTAPVEVEIKPAVATEGASSVLKIEAEDVQVYDIDVTNIKSDAVDPIAINLFVGKGLDESKMAFYHNDELIAFTYDATTGILSFSSTSFSPFTLLVSDTIAVDSAENLQFAINNGYTDITVVGDIENSESFTVADGQEVTVTLLDGVTVAGSGYDGTFYVTNGTLTLNGNGTIVGKLDREYSMAVWAYSENAKVVINGNTFTNEGHTDDDQFDMIYAKENALIEINGGTFNCYTPYWTLNLKDKSGAEIVVNGGSFYQYDPANSDTENPRANFVADGCESILVGDFYTVAEVNYATQAQINALAKTFANANEGDTIYLDALHYGCLHLGSGAYTYDYPANLTIVGTEGTYFTGISISDEVIAGWTFKNITFIGNPNDNDGNADGITVTTKATISDLTFDNCAFINGANFSMINTKNPFECYDTVTIKNCFFDRVEGAPAILLQGVKDATVENCVFNNAGYNAVQTNKSTGTVTIKDNYIYLTEDRALRIANQGANVIISGNEIVSEGDADGELFKSSGTNGTITLEGNTWNGQTDAEVVISNATDFIVKNA